MSDYTSEDEYYSSGSEDSDADYDYLCEPILPNGFVLGDQTQSLKAQTQDLEDDMTSSEDMVSSLEDEMRSLEDEMSSLEDRMKSLEDEIAVWKMT